MKKLVMTGSILTLALAIGTTAFAANTTLAAATVQTENTAIMAQTLVTPATADKAENNNTYAYGNQDGRYCNFVDADNDGYCDYGDMHDGNEHHRGRGGMHNGRHHGTYGTQSSGTGTTTSGYQTTGWSGGHC